MYEQLAQSDTSKLNNKDFDIVVQFIEKFSESVMVQDDQERQDNLCKTDTRFYENVILS